jgi:NhaP-type Na+/H+ or K+/H+ antiporter
MQYTQQHGQLLVPYPEEMFNAARPRPPSWFPVVLFTFFFGPLGAISAARRASRAQKGHNDRHPYWIAFGVTWVAGVVLSAILMVSVGIPAYLAVLHQAEAKAAQEHTTK